jgi:hypothetical protein
MDEVTSPIRRGLEAIADIGSLMTYSRVQLWLIPLLFCAHSSSLGLVIKVR